uniref:Beta-glucosidase n=1 Tax=Panagrolaimus sp. PS1159 TaxID=55785 RepID=A0AC35G015_9BILA
MLRVIVLLAFVQASYALQCHNASMWSVNNEIHNVPLISQQCASGVSACYSRYYNDGSDFRYEIGCDTSNACSNVPNCKLDAVPTRLCCCRTNDCVHPNASKAIEYPFPSGFKFSTATAAYQIEGDIACDSYHQWQTDIELLKAAKVHQYRFSLSWSRLLPTNDPSKPNKKGVEYYHKLIDALLEADIEPVVTIFHWDLPQSIMEEGGFLDSGISDKFAAYAKFCFHTYGSKVKTWVTINEPFSIVKYAYCGEVVIHAPGEFKSHCDWMIYRAGHNLLLSHMKASKIYKTFYKWHQRGQLGITISGTWFYPETDTPENRQAVEDAYQFSWGWWAHPIFGKGGDYPEIMKTKIEKASKENMLRSVSRLPKFTEQEKRDLLGSADFLGVNYYRSQTVRPRKPTEYSYMDSYLMNMDAGIATGYFNNWELIGDWIFNVPDGLRQLLNKFKTEYNNIPLIITENGVMDIAGEGLQDNTRIKYLRGHFANIAMAATVDGVNLKGYTLWSLMDNFEWGDGFTTKFGIHHIDYQSPIRARTPKASVDFYRNVILNNKVIGFGIN